ncbi:Radical SAM domain protein [Pyrobaculum islandicum DSM 4184]|uniref:Radical SAM domain protein n=1 Tax=Pyrobaculum islandicum (strain DSM 4184 / JCM 9189 / GEO3) TaxID=384616 RepID=A1RVR8_PYRIL|nr:radical SAM protein [Pyrobaculum islandicum]ABL89050.1 Radical SAM domain protein [Pyrobaculum islandicum DSM 4184]
MGICKLCGNRSILISSKLGVCIDCLRRRPRDALEIAARAHAVSRMRFKLPLSPPTSGTPCGICGRGCAIPEGSVGYCGLVKNFSGRLVRPGGDINVGVLTYYYDPIPTNCVADWICPASTGRGYPRYARSPLGEVGYYNLAVFYGACSLDCLYCQNWQYRTYPSNPRLVSVDELERAMGRRVTCVCFFGGDPAPQTVHALLVAKRAAEKGIRVCWETSGQIAPHLLDKVVDISLKTGGIVKFDLKAFTPSVYKALTDGEVDVVLRNFKAAARRFRERREVPLVVASILLVPGYVDEVEVDLLTKFIARVEPEVPTRFLAFHPDYMLDDLPPTSRRHAETALKIARENGLVEVSLGNEWLLGDYY